MSRFLEKHECQQKRRPRQRRAKPRLHASRRSRRRLAKSRSRRSANKRQELQAKNKRDRSEPKPVRTPTPAGKDRCSPRREVDGTDHGERELRPTPPRCRKSQAGNRFADRRHTPKAETAGGDEQSSAPFFPPISRIRATPEVSRAGSLKPPAAKPEPASAGPRR